MFAGKRYTDPSLENFERIILMGKVLEQRGELVKISVKDSKSQEYKESMVVTLGNIIMMPEVQEPRCLEKHGILNSVLGEWKDC